MVRHCGRSFTVSMPWFIRKRTKNRAGNRNIDAGLALREDAETLLAASYALSGEAAMEMAIRVFDHVPAHEEAATRLLFLFKLEDRFDEALAVEGVRATVRPRDASAWRFRSDLLVGAERVEEAVDALSSSLALKDDAPVRVMRGVLLARLGRDEEALRELDAALPRCASREGAEARAEILRRRAMPSP